MSVSYDTSFSCTYPSTPEEEQDDAYRTDMLRAFRLNEWDGSTVSTTLDRLFERVRHLPGLKSVLNQLRTRYPSIAHTFGTDDDRVTFQLLFSFDLFDRMHAAVCDLLERGEISEKRMNDLSENL